jgi:hypothetical protein
MEIALAIKPHCGNGLVMRTVEQIQSDIRHLSVEEMRKIGDFLDGLIEDQLEFT